MTIGEDLPTEDRTSQRFANGQWGEAMDTYINSYLMLSVFLLLSILLPIAALFVGRLLRPSNPTPEKQTTYESGVDPKGKSWVRFHVRYYMFALLFVLFDVEALFLLPWAVAFDQLGLFAFIEAVLFVVLLFIGLVYAWKKKVLEWV
jgi:NADH-quinone oxidoreductase subunit A